MQQRQWQVRVHAEARVQGCAWGRARVRALDVLHAQDAQADARDVAVDAEILAVVIAREGVVLLAMTVAMLSAVQLAMRRVCQTAHIRVWINAILDAVTSVSDSARAAAVDVQEDVKVAAIAVHLLAEEVAQDARDAEADAKGTVNHALLRVIQDARDAVIVARDAQTDAL